MKTPSFTNGTKYLLKSTILFVTVFMSSCDFSTNNDISAIKIDGLWHTRIPDAAGDDSLVIVLHISENGKMTSYKTHYFWNNSNSAWTLSSHQTDSIETNISAEPGFADLYTCKVHDSVHSFDDSIYHSYFYSGYFSMPFANDSTTVQKAIVLSGNSESIGGNWTRVDEYLMDGEICYDTISYTFNIADSSYTADPSVTKSWNNEDSYSGSFSANDSTITLRLGSGPFAGIIYNYTYRVNNNRLMLKTDHNAMQYFKQN